MKPCRACEAALDGRCAVKAANQAVITEHEAGGVWMARIVIPDTGSIVPQHSHRYAHLTSLVRGSMTVFREDGVAPERISAPHVLTVPAEVAHTFETHEPDTEFWCVHSVAVGGRPGIVALNELQFMESA